MWDKQADLFIQGIANTTEILNTLVETLNTRNTSLKMGIPLAL